jgi:hypothetical protein
MSDRERLNELESIKSGEGDINSSNNQRQMNARERIARQAEFLAQKEAADQGLEYNIDDGPADDDLDGGVSEAFAVTDDTLKTTLAQQPKQHAEPEKPRTYKLKINGQETELTEQELIERAQKVEAADRYLAEKKREADLLLAETKLRLEQPSAPADTAPEVSDEDLELVRALQVGDEYTAAKALKARLARSTSQPSIQLDDVAAKVKDDLEFSNAQKWFAQEYKDVVSDPKLMMIATQLDADFRKMDLAEKKVTPYMDRYRAIGEEVRKWKGTNPEATEKVQRKKETLKTIPQASMKSGSVVGEDDDNLSEEEYHQKAIQETARRRYQTHLGG